MWRRLPSASPTPSAWPWQVLQSKTQHTLSRLQTEGTLPDLGTCSSCRACLWRPGGGSTPKIGVPLGVPEYHPLQGRDNYPSAKQFTEEIEATFQEEKQMGTDFTQAEAAEVCDCLPDQLCPGPMAGIQESDKVRTIFDGSWGGANTHIQSNTIERTTAPTVMDCVQALHWLQASCKDSATPAVSGEVDLSGAWQTRPLNQAWTLLKADTTKAHQSP